MNAAGISTRATISKIKLASSFQVSRHQSRSRPPKRPPNAARYCVRTDTSTADPKAAAGATNALNRLTPCGIECTLTPESVVCPSTTLADCRIWDVYQDSRIDFSMIHGWSARGGADHGGMERRTRTLAEAV